MVFTHTPKKAELFTGIVQGKGEVLFSNQVSGGLKLRIQMNELSTGLELGASVAVSGVCLTVVNFQEGTWAEFDVIQETLDRSNLGMLQVGSHTNIERSLKMGDELGGHQVNGHVDCKTQILQYWRAHHKRLQCQGTQQVRLENVSLVPRPHP